MTAQMTQDDKSATGTTSALAAYVASKEPVPAQVLANARTWALATSLQAARGTQKATAAPLTAAGGIQGPKTPAWSALCQTVAASGTGTTPYAGVVVGALAASGDSSEEDFLAAVAVGIEVACRVQSAFGTRPGLFDVDAVALRLGTVAAVARLLGLDQSAVVLALGIAGGQSSGLALLRGTWAGALVLGRATADAVEACYLARDGYDASLEIIEGTGGAPDVMFPGASTTSITADLGSRWDSSTLVPAITALHEGD